MTALRVLAALGFPLLVGLGVARALPAVWGSSPLRWGAAFGLGSGLLTLEMFAFALAGLSWDPLGLALLPTACAAAAVVLGGRTEGSRQPARPALPPWRRVTRIGLTLVLVLLAGGSFVRAGLTPLSSWDGFAIWGFKAKALYVDGTVAGGFLLDPVRGYSHPDYPLHLPLLMAWVFLVLGEWHDGFVMLLFPAFYASLLLVCYAMLARLGPPEVALLFTLGLASVPQLLDHASAAMADLPLAYHLTAGVALLVRYLERGDRSTLLAAALMMGVAGWTKNEGMAIFAVAALWIGAGTVMREDGRRKALSDTLTFAAAGGAVFLPWLGWRLSFGLTTDLVTAPSALAGLASAPGRLVLIATALATEATHLSRWNLLWPLFLLASLLALGRWRARSLHLYAAAAWSGIGLYGLVYLLSARDLPWLLSTSLDRLLLHLAPLAVLTIGSAALAGRRPAADPPDSRRPGEL